MIDNVTLFIKASNMNLNNKTKYYYRNIIFQDLKVYQPEDNLSCGKFFDLFAEGSMN